jgi:hypothetical protein
VDQKIIKAIAASAAELSRRLAAEGIQGVEAQARIVAGAMPAIAEYEIDSADWADITQSGDHS